MSQFSRPADWLRQLFTPSRSGWQSPGQVSPEVSLVQPYDGGGYPLQWSGQMVNTFTLAAAAAGQATLLTNSNEQITRILAVGVNITAGVLPDLIVRIFEPTANVTVPISAIVTAPILNNIFALQLFSPILPQGFQLSLRWFGGDAATVVQVNTAFCRTPIGSVFYV